jgi:hypothetical protein
MRGDRVRGMPGRNHLAVAICGRTNRCAIERRSAERSSNRRSFERSSNRGGVERSSYGGGIERSSGNRSSVGNRVRRPISVGLRDCRGLTFGLGRERCCADFLVHT